MRYKHPELDITYKCGTYLKDKITYSDSINETIEHTYDERGNVTNTKDTYSNKVTNIAYTYDSVNRLTKEINGANGVTREYTYDEEGNISTVKEGDNIETCVYNAGRLVNVNNGDRTVENYSYDNCGNPTNFKSDTRNMWWERGTQLKKYGNETFVYDMQNKLHKRTTNGRTHRMYYDGDKLISYDGQVCVYDAIGNPTTYRVKAVTWEKDRNMTAYDGVAFACDGRGRRMSKGNITFSYSASGKLIGQSNGVEFIYDGNGIAGIVYGGSTYFYRKDAQGNITALIDSSGNVVVRYTYDAWGNHTVRGNDGTEIAEERR